jgi:hypothetical protein
MAFDLYGTADMLDVLRVTPVESAYWLDGWFNAARQFDTAEIMFDKIKTTRRLAPFVSPVVQGRVMRSRGFETRSFAPAYVKPKHIVDPNRQFNRRPGEVPGLGSSTPDARYNASVAENLAEERETIHRRENWMAAMAMIYGKVTITGEDYPTQVVDFRRNPDLTVALTGTARWGESAADPLGDINELRTLSFKESGAPITRLTMGLGAFDLFYEDTKVQNLLKGQEIGNVARTSDSTLSALGSPGQPFEFRGILQGANGQGRLEIFTYNEQYEDEDDVTQSIMDTYSVVGTGSAVRGVRCYGAIRDKRAGLQPLPLFPKMWDVEDPSVTYTMTQRAPLMVPTNIDNTFHIIAHDGLA